MFNNLVDFSHLSSTVFLSVCPSLFCSIYSSISHMKAHDSLGNNIEMIKLWPEIEISHDTTTFHLYNN